MSDEPKILHLHSQAFNGKRLQLAREFARISRAELAERVHASPSFVTACEKGRKRPSSELEGVLAESLQVQASFFYGPLSAGVEIENCHFRHRQAATKTHKAQLAAEMFVYSQLVAALQKVVQFPSVNLPHFDIDSTSAESVARSLRQRWGLSSNNPIGNLCRLVENAGIIVAFHTLRNERIDAASHAGPPPLILVSKEGRGSSRLNSDLGHELGELIFSKSKTSDAAHEKKINGFTGALLMPAEGFAPHFSAAPLKLPHLWALKRTWRCSASAILQRALSLELINYEKFVIWKRKLAARGWSKLEPFEPPLLEPECIAAALRLARQAGVTTSDLADHVGIREGCLAEILRRFLPGNVANSDEPVSPLRLLA